LLNNNSIEKTILNIKNSINKNILNNKTIVKPKTFKDLEKNLLTRKKIYRKNLLLLLRLYYNLQTYLMRRKFEQVKKNYLKSYNDIKS
jgi:hypothetical protein